MDWSTPTPTRWDVHGRQVHIGDTVLVEAEVMDYNGDTLTLKCPGSTIFTTPSNRVAIRTRIGFFILTPPDVEPVGCRKLK